MDLKLTQTNQNKFFTNIIVFLIPAFIIYGTSILGAIQSHNGAIFLKDFVPSPFVLGGMAYYLISTGIDYMKKIQGQK